MGNGRHHTDNRQESDVQHRLAQIVRREPFDDTMYNPTDGGDGCGTPGGDICTRTQTLLALPELKHSFGFQQTR